MSLQDKFDAAVNVIRSLPKSGSYQPSNELMLRFYSYYKQATEGPCEKPKPGFWDVVNRAKWEHWNKLGNMSRDDAMEAYVNELHKSGLKDQRANYEHTFDSSSLLRALLPFDTVSLAHYNICDDIKIVETMSYSEDIASFLSTTDGTEPVFMSGDLELVAGDVLARVRSGHNTPQGGSITSSPVSSPPRAASPLPRRHDSEDEFTDTLDNEPEPAVREAVVPTRLSNGHAHQISSQLTHLKVLEELPGTLARLERDVAALRKAVEGERVKLESRSGWRWPWQELSPPTLAFVLLWPFLAMRFAGRLQRRRI